MKFGNGKSFDFYCLLFFLLSGVGWLWEVLLYLVTRHTFINRGIYLGPYLPVYGAGGLLLYFLFYRWKQRPVRVFFSSLLTCSVLEYFSSWFLERHWGKRWWDYSGHFMNLNGRICLPGCVAFGAGGTLLLCVLIPFYEKKYPKLPGKLRIFLMVLLLLLFAADAAFGAIRPHMGPGITE